MILCVARWNNPTIPTERTWNDIHVIDKPTSLFLLIRIMFLIIIVICCYLLLFVVITLIVITGILPILGSDPPRCRRRGRGRSSTGGTWPIPSPYRIKPPHIETKLQSREIPHSIGTIEWFCVFFFLRGDESLTWHEHGPSLFPEGPEKKSGDHLISLRCRLFAPPVLHQVAWRNWPLGLGCPLQRARLATARCGCWF